MPDKRLYALPLGLGLLVCSCGNYTPPEAVIEAVEANRTTTYTLNLVPTTVVDGTIHFKVAANKDSTAPVGGAAVELSGTSPTVGDPASGFVGPGGALLDPSDPNHMEATSDASGVVSARYQFTVPKCSKTDDLVVTATISASIGGSSATWIDTITVAKDPSC
jgi:hypothetical protein